METKSRMNKVVCLKDEMDNFMKYIGLDDRMYEIKMLEVWEECVGKAIAKFSNPIEIRKNKLFVSVENAVWRYELSVKKQEILQRLNDSLNKNNDKSPLKQIKKVFIKDIVFI